MSDTLCCSKNDSASIDLRRRLFRELHAVVEESREMAAGYRFRFPGDEATARLLLEVIVYERSCCPFLSFDLGFEHEKGPIWLTIEGPDGTKDLTRAELAAAGFEVVPRLHGSPR